MSEKRILVTGALGQIGSELVLELRRRYGSDRVVASDIRVIQLDDAGMDGPFEYIDCTHQRQIQEVVRRYDVGT
ncbi:MAG: NAD-dependent epimerase/dehydratase family protein, partial [Acidobacteriota bacterium]